LSASLSDGSSLPYWLKFDPATGTFRGAADSTAYGTLQVRVTASDREGASVSADFRFEVMALPVTSLPSPVLATNRPPATLVVIPETAMSSPVALSLPIESPAAGPVSGAFEVLASQPSPSPVQPDATGAPLSAPISSAQPRADLLGSTLTSTEGFPVSVLRASGSSAAAGESLVVVKPMTEIAVRDGGVSFTLPNDTFAHASPNAIVTLTASQADGTALPGWLNFDPRSGTFFGTAPEGFQGELVLRVVARDKDGAQAVAAIRIRVASGLVQPQGDKSQEPVPTDQRTALDGEDDTEAAEDFAGLPARAQSEARESKAIVGKKSLGEQFKKYGAAGRQAGTDELIRVGRKGAAQRAAVNPRT
jgi:hypothetical protein